MKNPQEPIEDLLEALVYAPIGIVLDVVERYPEHVERGREQFATFERLGSAVLRGFGFAPDFSRSKASSSPAGPDVDDSEDAIIDAEVIEDEELLEDLEVMEEELGESDVIEDMADELADEIDVDLIEILKGNVKQVSTAIETMPEAVVRELIELEKAGKCRITVLSAADQRLNDLADAG